MKKRTRIEIIYDILSAIKKSKGEIKLTHLIYKSNLSHKVLKEFLKELIIKQLLINVKFKNQKSFTLTEKGHNFIKDYSKMKEFLKSYGI